MNIFQHYLEKILNLLKEESQKKHIKLPTNLNSINVEIPPEKFDYDLSTNVALILSKINQKTPSEIGEYLRGILNKDEFIDQVDIVKPGFINIKLKKIFWSNFIKQVLYNPDQYGINQNDKKNSYLIEFVSANPTGPLHVGHCRGAVLGDALSNLLIFNKHKVTREYYVNDYGNQITHFTKSVFLRIREIL